MSVDINAWNHSYQTFEGQVEQFNTKLQTHSLNEEELDSIYSIVKREVDRLREFSRAAKEREDELDGHTCCNLTPTTKAIWGITILNMTYKVCAIAGALLAAFSDQNNLTAKWAGLGLLGGGSIFDFASSTYGTIMNLRGVEIVGLSKLNKDGVKHAEVFKKFLKELKKIKKLEKKILEENESKKTLTDHVFTPFKALDDRISSCLQSYESLPSSYRREDLYCRIISILIQHLPPRDPLRQGLAAFEPPEKEDLSVLAEKSLQTYYFQTSRRKRSFFHEHEEATWSHEEHSKTKDTEIEPIDPNQMESEYRQEVAYYKQEVARRFKLNQRIAFLETANGWRIDTENGIKRMETNLASSHSKNEKEDNFAHSESIV